MTGGGNPISPLHLQASNPGSAPMQIMQARDPYIGPFQQLLYGALGQAAGTGMEMFRDWVNPDPQRELTRTQVDANKQKNRTAQQEELENLRTRYDLETDPERKAYLDIEGRKLAELHGVPWESVRGTAATHGQIQARDRYNQISQDALQGGTPQGPFEQGLTGRQPSSETPIEAPAPTEVYLPMGVGLNNPADQPRQMGPPYAQSQLPGEPVPPTPVQLPSVPAVPPQQQVDAQTLNVMGPNSRYQMEQSIGFRQPPRQLSQDDLLKLNSAAERGLWAAHIGRLIETNHVGEITDSMRQAATMGADAYTAQWHLAGPGATISQPFAAMFTPENALQGASFWNAAVKGDPTARTQAATAMNNSLRTLEYTYPEFAKNPYMRAAFITAQRDFWSGAAKNLSGYQDIIRGSVEIRGAEQTIENQKAVVNQINQNIELMQAQGRLIGTQADNWKYAQETDRMQAVSAARLALAQGKHLATADELQQAALGWLDSKNRLEEMKGMADIISTLQRNPALKDLVLIQQGVEAANAKRQVQITQLNEQIASARGLVYDDKGVQRPDTANKKAELDAKEAQVNQLTQEIKTGMSTIESTVANLNNATKQNDPAVHEFVQQMINKQAEYGQSGVQVVGGIMLAPNGQFIQQTNRAPSGTPIDQNRAKALWQSSLNYPKFLTQDQWLQAKDSSGRTMDENLRMMPGYNPQTDAGTWYNIYKSAYFFARKKK